VARRAARPAMTVGCTNRQHQRSCYILSWHGAIKLCRYINSSPGLSMLNGVQRMLWCTPALHCEACIVHHCQRPVCGLAAPNASVHHLSVLQLTCVGWPPLLALKPGQPPPAAQQQPPATTCPGRSSGTAHTLQHLQGKKAVV
jgi:hypothetical protein